MNILLCVTKYPDRIDDSYLISDLADEWARLGHEVTVAVIQWDKRGSGEPPRMLRFPSGVTAHYFVPLHTERFGRLFERLSRWLLSSYRLRRPIAAAIGDGSRYDVALFFAPVVTLAAQVADYAGKARHNYLYVTDFFPYAHRDLGLVPGPLFAVARWAENRLMRKFRTLGTMSPRNADYLRRHYVVDPGQRVVVDMLWGPAPVAIAADPAATRAAFGLPAGRRLLLFGGQLSEGRGVEDIIAAAEIAAERALDLAFVVIGDGRLRPRIEAAAARLPGHLHYRPPVARDRYLELAAACDAGLVVTIRDTDVPTFPSRTIDYLRVGLPVLAAVERSTDFGEIIAGLGVGVHLTAGEPQALVDAGLALFADPARHTAMRTACSAAARDIFSAGRAARDMLDHAVGEKG